MLRDKKTVGRWFSPQTWPIFFPKIYDSQCDRIHLSLTAVIRFDNCHVFKYPVAWKECCQECRFKDLSSKVWIGTLAAAM